MRGAIREKLFAMYATILGFMPPVIRVSVEFRRKHGCWPDLRHPLTFSEKIQSRKLSARNDAKYALLADKVEVKKYVAKILGDEWVIPTWWSGSSLPSLQEREWSPPYVIKANHGSGFNVFVTSSDSIDWVSIERSCRSWLRKDYPSYLNETFYSLIRRRLLVEPMIQGQPNDYKFYVFGGVVKYVHVDVGRFSDHRRCFFDREWRKQSFGLECPLIEDSVPAPQHLTEMVAAAEALGAGIDFVRIDFYDTVSGPKFGEMTFAPGSGYQRFAPKGFDRVFGDEWK